VVQGGAAICGSSRVTRNWMPLHGSLSNISRFSIVRDNEKKLNKKNTRVYTNELNLTLGTRSLRENYSVARV
jgi:hypothetical protein